MHTSVESPTEKRIVYPAAPGSSRSTTTTAPRSPTRTAGSKTPTRAETRAWVEAENKVTFAYLDAIPAARRRSASG